jgi:hypothetical protein
MAESVRRFKGIMERTGLTFSQAAILAGVSPATVRTMLMTGLAPERGATKRAVETFVTLNASAKSRADLRCP